MDRTLRAAVRRTRSHLRRAHSHLQSVAHLWPTVEHTCAGTVAAWATGLGDQIAAFERDGLETMISKPEHDDGPSQ